MSGRESPLQIVINRSWHLATLLTVDFRPVFNRIVTYVGYAVDFTTSIVPDFVLEFYFESLVPLLPSFLGNFENII